MPQADSLIDATQYQAAAPAAGLIDAEQFKAAPKAAAVKSPGFGGRITEANRALSEQTQEQVFGPVAQQFADSYTDFIQQGRDYQKGQGSVETLKQGAHQLLDILGMAGAWAAPVQKAVVEPIKEQITKIGAKGDKYTQHDFEALADMFEAAFWTASGKPKAGELPRTKGVMPSDHTTVEPVTSPTPETIKPRIRVVGATPEGKPRVRVVQPEEARASVAEATGKMHPPVDPMTPEPMAQTQLAGDWLGAHQISNGIIVQAADKRSVGAHEWLDAVIPNAGNKLAGGLLRKLREHVDNVPIKFTRGLLEDDTGGLSNDWTGVYRPLNHDVQIQIEDVGGGRVSVRNTMTTVHELIHAATSRFMWYNPEHPAVRELEALYADAKRFYREQKEPPWLVTSGEPYGLKNSREFLAELSKPSFNGFLSRVSAAQKGSIWIKKAYNRLASIVSSIMGLDRDESQYLHNVYGSLQDIMAEQSKRRALREDPELKAHRAEIGLDPALKESKKEVASALEEAIRAINPEALGPKAKMSAAVIAHRVAERIQRTNVAERGGRERTEFWNNNPHLATNFLSSMESGATFADNPRLAALARHYRAWSDRIFKRDTILTGLKYEPESNYIPHLFESPESVRGYLSSKYGRSWGDPGFIKERSFKTIADAIAAGFKLKYKNPEEMMQARQYASDIAATRTSILRDMEDYGLALRKEPKERAPGPNYTPQRSPTGQWYYVHNDAFAPLRNIFDSFSLWRDQGNIGRAFRGGMWLKNAIVPIHLALSGFHVLHVAHIDNAAAMSRAWEGMLQGRVGPVAALGQTLRATFPFSLYDAFIRNPMMGARYVKVFDDAIAAEKLTEGDETALQLMLEGGYTPHMDAVYRNAAVEKTLPEAWREVVTKAPWKLPAALMTTLRRPIFEVWIPNLKTYSYLRDAHAALEADPSLVGDSAKRKLALRRIQKSVDNRYGEMSYNTLFWTRWAKDLMVLNTLSLGWQLGFIREYGGGTMDVGQFARRAASGTATQAIKEGMLHRPLFVTAYTTTALAYGGLLTWAMTGQSPNGWMDYVYPQIGGQNADGSPKRVNTMFYTREFASIAKHMENQGIISGLGHLAASKSSGWFGTLTEFLGGVTGTRPIDDFGREFTDPDGPLYKRLSETLAHTLGGLEPISLQNIQQQYPTSGGPLERAGQLAKGVAEHPKEAAMSAMGFTPAPKYVSEGKTEGLIQRYYHDYVAPRETPYASAERSKEYTQLRRMFETDDPKFSDAFADFVQKRNLNTADVHRLEKNLTSKLSSSERMFGHLPPDQQEKVLRQASPADHERLLPHANKKVKQKLGLEETE